MCKRISLLSLILFAGLACDPSRDSQTKAPNPLANATASTETPELIANFRGYAATNRSLNQRFFGRSDAFILDAYLEKVEGPDEWKILGPLKDLLGIYEGDGMHPALKNAQPNGMNMLLWYTALNGFASDLGQICGPTGQPLNLKLADLKPEMRRVLLDLCQGSSSREQSLRSLWAMGMQADAPDEELQAWLDYVQSPSFNVDANEGVRMIIVAMLYNSYFLLKQ